MKHIQQLLEGRCVGIISAHPGNHLTHSNALAIIREQGITAHELTLTYGEATTVNLRPDKAFVKNGGRVREGEAAAALLGLASNVHFGFPDGNLAEHTDILVPLVRRWMDMRDVTLALNIGGLSDHLDHKASADIARRAAALAGISVLELQQDNQGEWQAPLTAAAQDRAVLAATLHQSQFRPHSLGALEQYPIFRDASYTYIPAAPSEAATPPQYAILES